MSHIKGYVQFISEQNQGQTKKLEKRIADTRRLLQLARTWGSNRGEELHKKRLDKLLQTKESNKIIEKETAPKVAPAQNGDKSNAKLAAISTDQDLLDISQLIKKKQDIINGLRNTPGNTQTKTIERLKQEIRDLKDETFSEPIKIEPLPIFDPIKIKPYIPKPAPIISPVPAAVEPVVKKPVVRKPVVDAAKKQEPFQMSSGRGNEALRARNMAKAKARKQNPTVNTKPTLNKAGTDSGSGVDALRQRINKRSEERGK